MRELLFRGKAVDSGKWVEGDLHHNGDTARPMTLIGQVVMSRDKHTTELSLDGFWLSEVDPATVGQYTGLNDKNGRKIFEGDIVGYYDGEQSVVAEVVFACGAFGIAKKTYLSLCFPNACNNDNYMSLWEIMWNQDDTDIECAYVLEVIGNIHDDPELSDISEQLEV